MLETFQTNWHIYTCHYSHKQLYISTRPNVPLRQTTTVPCACVIRNLANSEVLKPLPHITSHSPEVFVWKPQLNANLKIRLFDALCNLQQKGEFLYVVVAIVLASQGLKLPLADRFCKVGECVESNCIITVIDFGSCYCASQESSANTCPNLNMDT